MLFVDAHRRVIDDMVAHAFRIQALEFRRLLRLKRERRVKDSSQEGEQGGVLRLPARPLGMLVSKVVALDQVTGSGRTLGKSGR